MVLNAQTNFEDMFVYKPLLRGHLEKEINIIGIHIVNYCACHILNFNNFLFKMAALQPFLYKHFFDICLRVRYYFRIYGQILIIIITY